MPEGEVTMFGGLKKLFGSGTFWLTIVGSAVYAGMVTAGVPEEVALKVLGLFGLNTIQRAAKDMGKEKAIAKAKSDLVSSVAEIAGESPSKRAAALRAAALGEDEADES